MKNEMFVVEEEKLSEQYEYCSTLPSIIDTYYSQRSEFEERAKKDATLDYVDVINNACVNAIDRYYSDNKMYLRYLKCKNSLTRRFVERFARVQLPSFVKNYMKRRKCRMSKKDLENYRKQDELWEKALSGEVTDQSMHIHNLEQANKSLMSRINQLEREIKVYGGESIYD